MKLFLIFLFLILISCAERNSNHDIDSFIEINGNKIHYKVNGKGDELIMVHGGYLDLEMWQWQVDEFEKERKIIRFSDLGHGYTVANNHPVFGYQIIEELTSATSENPTTLIGLSWGAMICVDYALKHPKKVDKLILVSPGLNGWAYFQDTIAAKNNALRQIATQNNDIERSAQLFHQNWVIGPRRQKSDLEPEFYRWSSEAIKENMQKHWGEDWSKLDSIPAMERLHQIQIPTYIIIGDQDGDDIKLIAEEYSQGIRNSSKIVIKDAAHLLNIESSVEFNNILRKILAE